MRAAICTVEAGTGSINRYEIGGGSYRRTHGGTTDARATFTPAFVEEFRANPDPDFAVTRQPKAAGGKIAAISEYR